jgi:hypothetical protein
MHDGMEKLVSNFQELGKIDSVTKRLKSLTLEKWVLSIDK